MWRFQWKDKDIKPLSVTETFSHCTNLLPDIQLLLRLFITLPINPTTSEKTLSTLKYIKSYLKPTMTKERVNGLVIANIYKKEKLTEIEFLQQFSNNSLKSMQIMN